MRKLWAARRILACSLVALAVVTLASACAPAAGKATSGEKPLKVGARTLPGVGKVLVKSNGYALYMFAPDNRRSVTCTGACAGTWPPLKLSADGVPVAGPGVKQSLLGSVPDPAGGRVVTYGGWPLYGYTGDIQPGQATGQALDLNGGEWYVMRVSGQPLEPAP